MDRMRFCVAALALVSTLWVTGVQADEKAKVTLAVSGMT